MWSAICAATTAKRIGALLAASAGATNGAASGAASAAPMPLTTVRRLGVQFVSVIAVPLDVSVGRCLSFIDGWLRRSSGAATVGRFRRRNVECRIAVEEAERLQDEAAMHHRLHRKILRPDDVVVAEGVPDRDRPVGDRPVLLRPGRAGPGPDALWFT